MHVFVLLVCHLVCHYIRSIQLFKYGSHSPQTYIKFTRNLADANNQCSVIICVCKEIKKQVYGIYPVKFHQIEISFFANLKRIHCLKNECYSTNTTGSVCLVRYHAGYGATLYTLQKMEYKYRLCY